VCRRFPAADVQSPKVTAHRPTARVPTTLPLTASLRHPIRTAASKNVNRSPARIGRAAIAAIWCISSSDSVEYGLVGLPIMSEEYTIQYRLRSEDLRVYYDVSDDPRVVHVLRVLQKKTGATVENPT
jgi:hypothetical protein